LDPGAYAIDTSPTTITVTGTSAIHSALQTVDLSSLGPVTADGTYGPWIISYKARDSAGNESRLLLRRIHIDATCRAGQVWCPATAGCELKLLCLPVKMPQQGYKAISTPYVPTKDTNPPSLQLLLHPTDTQVASHVPGPQVVESWVTAGVLTYSDPGWVAIDARDGDLSSAVSAFGLSAVQQAVETGSPSDPGAPLPVRYLVSDAAGNSAAGLRLVNVVCSPDSQPCSRLDGSSACTKDGICDALPPMTAPKLPAMLQLQGPAVTFVPQGQLYTKCTPHHPVDMPCDQVWPEH
jgi:hypothetical protein